jgi:hypothetical protein
MGTGLRVFIVIIIYFTAYAPLSQINNGFGACFISKESLSKYALDPRCAVAIAYIPELCFDIIGSEGVWQETIMNYHNRVMVLFIIKVVRRRPSQGSASYTNSVILAKSGIRYSRFQFISRVL